MGERLFRLIETYAILPDGRFIHATYSKPQGYTNAEFVKIDDALITAFGKQNSISWGTVLDY